MTNRQINELVIAIAVGIAVAMAVGFAPDTVETLLLIIICPLGMILLLGWCAFKWYERTERKDKEAGQKIRKGLGYE